MRPNHEGDHRGAGAKGAIMAVTRGAAEALLREGLRRIEGSAMTGGAPGTGTNTTNTMTPEMQRAYQEAFEQYSGLQGAFLPYQQALASQGLGQQGLSPYQESARQRDAGLYQPYQPSDADRWEAAARWEAENRAPWLPPLPMGSYVAVAPSIAEPAPVEAEPAQPTGARHLDLEEPGPIGVPAVRAREVEL